MDPKPTQSSSSPRQPHPTMRPVANPPASDRPASVPMLMSPVTPGANLHPTSLNPPPSSTSVTVNSHKPDPPATALPSPVPSAASPPSPVQTEQTEQAEFPTHGMNGTAAAAQPPPTDSPAPRPNLEDTRSPVQRPIQQTLDQAPIPNRQPARPISRPNSEDTRSPGQGSIQQTLDQAPVPNRPPARPISRTISCSSTQGSNSPPPPRPQRVDTDGTQTPPQPNEAIWGLWLRRLKEVQEVAKKTLSPIAEPRAQLLYDACMYRDLFYLVLHQVFCRLHYDPSIYATFPALREERCKRGFDRVKGLLEDNSTLPTSTISYFAHFPGKTEELMKEPWYPAKFQELINFLSILDDRIAPGESPIFRKVVARKYPPLVEELKEEFEVHSPVFMSVIFASLCRQLYHPCHLTRLNQTFRRDLVAYRQRVAPSIRSALIEEYRQIPMGPSEPPRPPPLVTSSPSLSPAQFPTSRPHIPVSEAGQPVVVPSSSPLPSANPTQPPATSPITANAHPAPPSTSPLDGSSSHSPSNVPPVFTRAPGGGHVPYQYPSQQALPPQNGPPRQLQQGQLWQVNGQGQLVPLDMTQLPQGQQFNQWQAHPNHHLPNQVPYRVNPHQSVEAQTPPTPTQMAQHPLPQTPQAHQAWTQMRQHVLHTRAHQTSAQMAVRQARIQQRQPASQIQHSPASSYASPSPPVSAPPYGWPSQISQQNGLQPGQTPTIPSNGWPSQISQQNGLQPAQSPTVPSSQRRTSQEVQQNSLRIRRTSTVISTPRPARPSLLQNAQNQQQGGQQVTPTQEIPASATWHQVSNPQAAPTTPLLPPAGYRLPLTAQPNPMRLGLHQADLRDPMKKLMRRGANGQMIDIELFQYLSGFVLSPTFIDPNTMMYHWNFSLSADDCLRCPRMITSGQGQRPIRTYQAGCRTFRLRSIAVSNSEQKSATDLWPTAHTVWPSVFYIHVNGHEMQVRRKAHNGKDLSLDITDNLHEGDNKISIHLLLEPNECKDFSYVFGIESMEIGTFQHLRNRCGTISAADVREKIQKRLNPSSSDNDDLTVVTDSLTVSLTDPFTAQVFRTPARSIHCGHLECFDLDTFISTRKSVSGPSPMNDNWRCPICNGDARPQCLIVDQFLEEVRAELIRQNQLEGAQAIEIKADGHWTLKAVVDDVCPSPNTGKRKAPDAPNLDVMSSRPKVEPSPNGNGISNIPQEPIVIDLD